MLLLASACGVEEVIREAFSAPASPRDGYLQALESVGLAESGLARAWEAAGRDAIASALEVTVPYREEGLFLPGEPAARGYLLSLRRGQRLRVEAGVRGEEPTKLFLELFQASPDSARPHRRVVAPEPGDSGFSYEARREADYLLLVQPELLRGGRYQLSLVVEGALSFPVEGRDTRAILSFFGDDREAGRRVHHGVDIFAPRGTPVLAAAAGRVNRVGTANLGGNVVWIRDEERNQSHYYAHLDTQLVEEGMEVKPGDTLGTVGNTGNARSTPPHLHFGIYQRGEGPVDPWHFLLQPSGPPAELAVDTLLLNRWVRVREGGIRLRATPSVRGPVVAEMERYTPLRVVAGSGEWYRVELPDGRGGYVAGRLTEEPGRPIGSTAAEGPAGLRRSPGPGALVMEEIATGEALEILAAYGPFLLVRRSGGAEGWWSRPAPTSAEAEQEDR